MLVHHLQRRERTRWLKSRCRGRSGQEQVCSRAKTGTFGKLFAIHVNQAKMGRNSILGSLMCLIFKNGITNQLKTETALLVSDSTPRIHSEAGKDEVLPCLQHVH